MTWTIEIIRAFFVAFGALQSIANLTYLVKADGIALAKKQHRELPDKVTCKQLRIKVICMFSFGVLFLVIGLISYFTRSYYKFSFIITIGAFTFYELFEAVYYKYWRTTGAFLLSTILLLLTIIA
ncbi:MAG: hypothetical protein ACRC3H_17310 [Lachnospiraceae bacterium]